MQTPSDASLARSCAELLCESFLAYNREFRSITRRAAERFERRDWLGGQRDAGERIGLYDGHVRAAVGNARERLGPRAHDRALWSRIKNAFRDLIDDYPDLEFQKTFFSSVTRRLFGTHGVDRALEFCGADAIPLRNIAGPLIGRSYVSEGSLAAMFRAVLDDFHWQVGYQDVEASARYVAEQVTEHYRRFENGDTVLCVDVMTPVFYRGKRAYLVGKATGWTRLTPLIIALENGERGIRVDAVILTDRCVSAMFGFARSYFHVDLETVGAGIVFLRRILPRKPVNELFTILGRAKQGKTERYRGFARHLDFSRDRFIVAPGKKGMVMVVFTLPSYDVVFKVIRDRFGYPKNTTAADVKRRYELVARHDKAGRLVDTQEFRMLEFDTDRFAPDLLAELLSQAGDTVQAGDDSVVIRHAYIERRLRPLDIYLREADRGAAVRAVIDYGQALRDLAATDIFPGDLLLKNFGVTRHGRVIFYDYDELCLLTDVEFRDMPQPRCLEDEMSAEPWFYVGENDVFPEEFATYLGLDAELMAVFREHHGELLTAAWWRGIQDRIRAGEVIDVLPY